MNIKYWIPKTRGLKTPFTMQCSFPFMSVTAEFGFFSKFFQCENDCVFA